MLSGYRNLLRGISTNIIGKIGVSLTTASFLLMVLFEGLSLSGVIRNAYVGLVTYLTLPAFFVLGLILIPVGWWLHLRRSGKTTRELMNERFDPDDLRGGFAGARVFGVTLALTGVNLVFLGAASMRTVQFMDQATFCGTACHVMNPEWTVYQSSPHARVDCVECHVGEGIGALVESKLSGLRQTLHFALGTYSRPIPTPVDQLRPARETCQRCHFADLDAGHQVATLVSYARDRASTPLYTTLSMKVGPARGERGWIHWHASDASQIRYASRGGEREQILWVESLEPDGSVRRFENRTFALGQEDEAASVRTMDCVDCHNRVAHVYRSAEKEVDRLIETGVLSRDLPFAKRRALRTLSRPWASEEEARAGIRSGMLRYYQRYHSRVALEQSDALERAVGALVEVWRRNIHPAMGIDWKPYPSQLGHPAPGRGCFRCHNSDMIDTNDRAISSDCTLCHSILAEESASPFAFLTGEVAAEDQARATWLEREFAESVLRSGVLER